MSDTQRTFRVFVSSTFEDLKDERDALQRCAFPPLAAVCESLGARFQAIDLRWGVRDEAAVNQKTMEICLSEIARCQQTGIRPNFIILLGERYGWCPLPAHIEAAEFEAVRNRIAPRDRSLIDSWYERDDNSVPPEYLLKARTGEWVDANRWNDLERQMHAALCQGASEAGLPPERRFRYEASATHQEILMGLGSTPEDAKHVFAFCRTGFGDEDAGLHGLKRELQRRLGVNVNEFGAGDPEGLCRIVVEKLTRAIREQAAQFRSQPPLEAEIAQHDAFARERSRFFTGRKESLRRLSDHLKGPGRRTAVVIHGESGSGKSALLAVASELAAESEPRGIVIRRFIGATPSSSDGVSLLRSICSQSADYYGRPREFPSTFNELVSAFREETARGAGRPTADDFHRRA